MPNFKITKIKRIPKNNAKLWKAAAIISIVLFLIVLSFFVNRFMLEDGRGKKIIKESFPVVSIKKMLIKKAEEINEEKEDIKKFNEKCEGCVRRNIDGMYVLSKNSNLFPITIMVDNHFNARPIYGLDKASLVYETEVEGSFTRYMAVFDSGENIKKIGPVRSARPYFVDWARELGGVYAHCGGSPEALVQIIQENILDLNEFYNGEYFWRTNEKQAPHNILTSISSINKFLERNNKEEGSFVPWEFKDDAASTTAMHPKIKVNFNHPDFKVVWKYNKIDNDYIRYLAGRIHLTAENNIISAKNIIIQKTKGKVIDNKLRLDLETIGDGVAIICLDGKCEEGKWEKQGKGVRTKYYYSNGDKVKFNAGLSWIEVVLRETEIIY